MGLLSDYMLKPETSEVSTAEIIDFYCRYGDKKMTAERYCISIKELNTILKAVRNKEHDKYTEIGMKRSDF